MLLSTDDILDQSIANLIIVFYTLGSVSLIIIAAMMIVMYLYSKRWDSKLKQLEPLSNSNRHSRSKIYGVTSIGWLWNLYILLLDITALTILHSEIEEKKLNALPIITLIFTSIGLLLSTVFWGLSSCLSVSETRKKLQFIFLALSMLGPIFAIVIHVPYIVIAFLNDAYHASSVFIFYTVATFVLFAALNFTIGTCQRGLIHTDIAVDEMTSFDPKLRILANNVQPPNAGEVQATLCMTSGTQMETNGLEINEQQLSLMSLRLPHNQAPDNIQPNTQLTLHFGLIPLNTIDIDCLLISNALQESTRVPITVQNAVTVTVNQVQHNDGVTTITFKQPCSMTIVNGRLMNNSGSIHCYPKLTKTKQGNKCIYSILIPAFMFFVLALIVLIACVLIFVPINDALSDAPNRLVGFYQSVLVLLGAYIVYKKYFKKKPSVERVVKKRRKHIPTDRVTTDEEWQQLSKDERVAAFYSRIVDLVAVYPNQV